MTKVSVIIPVHNTGSFLRGCLCSVLAQTMDGMEVICVDDCSTDDSPAILREAARSDSRLKVIRLAANLGVSHARNIGLAHAGGEFVYFMDSDDRIDPGYLQAMYDTCTGMHLDQVVNFNYLIEDDSSVPGAGAKWEFVLGEPGFHPSALITNYARCCTWMRLYRKSFLLENGLTFPEEVSASEDYYFSRVAQMTAESIYTFFGPAYHYLSRRGSLSKLNTFDHIIASCLSYRRFKAMSIPLEGIKLFYCEPMLAVDSEEKYDFIKAFFEEMQPDMLKNPDLYTNFDCFCFDSLSSCQSWEEWSGRHPAGRLMPAYLHYVKSKER